MATIPHVTVGEYLKQNHEPECELIAGKLVEKPLGTLEHMRMERRLERLLTPFEQQGLGHVAWELSVRRGNEVRIPDVIFFAASARFEAGILLDAPLLCVEILSPSQRVSELFAKCEAYREWGVSHCWIIDPIGKKAWEYDRHSATCLLPHNGILQAGKLAVSLIDLFR